MDYRQLYALLFHEVETVIEGIDDGWSAAHARDRLIQAQRDCEERYLAAEDDDPPTGPA